MSDQSEAGPRLLYLYVGSDDVDRDLAFYCQKLGGKEVWSGQDGGTKVAALELGAGPLVILAGHRDAPSVLPIWRVDDLEAVSARLQEQGWTGPLRRVEVPDGPCLVLSDPSGNQCGFLQVVRPNIMARHGRGPAEFTE